MLTKKNDNTLYYMFNNQMGYAPPTPPPSSHQQLFATYSFIKVTTLR